MSEWHMSQGVPIRIFRILSMVDKTLCLQLFVRRLLAERSSQAKHAELNYTRCSSL